MKKLKSFLKYTGVTITVLALVLAALLISFLFRSKAPLLSGEVAYGIKFKDNLELDIYAPTNKVYDKSPVVIYIHGGAWIGGTKGAINFNRFNGAVNTLRAKGYTFVCPNYTLSGKGKSAFPDCILDVYSAIDWTKKNAQTYGLDTTNLGLWGESAGAQIAMMIAFSDTTLAPATFKKTKFNYLVDVYGPNDLAKLYHNTTIDKINASLNRFSKIFGTEVDIKQYVFGFDPVKDSLRAKEILTKYSPISRLKHNDFPTLIIHGESDQIVPIEQSILLKSRMDTLSIINETHLLPGMDHSFRNATQAQKDSTQVWIAEFIDKCYKRM